MECCFLGSSSAGQGRAANIRAITPQDLFSGLKTNINSIPMALEQLATAEAGQSLQVLATVSACSIHGMRCSTAGHMQQEPPYGVLALSFSLHGGFHTDTLAPALPLYRLTCCQALSHSRAPSDSERDHLSVQMASSAHRDWMMCIEE